MLQLDPDMCPGVSRPQRTLAAPGASERHRPHGAGPGVLLVRGRDHVSATTQHGLKLTVRLRRLL